MKFSRAKLICLNVSGALYTVLAIFLIATFNLSYTCPGVYSDCFWPTVNAVIILAQISINLLLFHYYNTRNQVQFWTAKSTSLLMDNRNFEQNVGAALNKILVTNGTNAKHTKNNPQHFTHEIQNYTKYAICEDGTYVDLRSESHGLPQPSDEKEDSRSPTKYCADCKMVTPQRCQHCPLCRICVLRKDHHCFLLGACAGLANQRYFIVFLFWASIGAVYGSTFNFSYLDKHVIHWFPFGWLYYIGPVALARWICGYETLFHALLAIAFSMSFASSLAAFGFFVFQMLYTLNGYTMYDFHKAGHRRSESDGDNYQERLALVFGRRWWLNFIIPQFWQPNQMNEKIARNIFLSVSKDL